eukprot:6200273-Alexandrium_andersonii.AAC.1
MARKRACSSLGCLASAGRHCRRDTPASHRAAAKMAPRWLRPRSARARASPPKLRHHPSPESLPSFMQSSAQPTRHRAGLGSATATIGDSQGRWRSRSETGASRARHA